MERRLIVAFLVSTLLVLGYQVLYYGPRAKKAQEAQEAARLDADVEQRAEASQDAAPTQAPAPTETMLVPGDTLSEPPAGLEQADGVAGKVVTVQTPLFHVTLSSRGGEVISVQLLDYLTDGIPVELLRQDGRVGALSMTLIGDERNVRLGDTVFEPIGPDGSSALADGAVINVDSAPRTLILRASSADGSQIERFYTFTPDSYMIECGIRYASSQWQFARSIEWSMGSGLRATEANVKEDHDAFKAWARVGDEFYRKKRSNFHEKYSGVLQWTALKTKYFTAILLPPEPSGGDVELVGVKDDNFMTTAVRLPAVSNQGRVEQNLGVYFGPLDYDGLKAMGRGIDKTIEIGFDRVKIFRPVSTAILWTMLKLHNVIPNYGWIILIISVFTKVLFYRLTHKSFKSMAEMQALQPRLTALKEKYKDDKKKLSEETMKAYKEGGVNPIGGCLPMLLQMPVFLALFNVLRSTIEVRQAPFIGWITDLSQPDVLFTMPFSLPFVGANLSVLPIIMGGSMLVQSKIGGSIAGPGGAPGQPKAMLYMMPIVFTVLFYNMPSGLVLYWIVNTVLSVAQQWYINKGTKKNSDVVVEGTPTKPTKPAKQSPRKSRPKKGS